MYENYRLDLAVPVSTTDHLRGTAPAPVTVVEYGDSERSVCRSAEPGVHMLLERFGHAMRFAYCHFLMESAHPHALMAATEAAAAQGRIGALDDHLMQQNARRFNEMFRRMVLHGSQCGPLQSPISGPARQLFPASNSSAEIRAVPNRRRA